MTSVLTWLTTWFDTFWVTLANSFLRASATKGLRFLTILIVKDWESNGYVDVFKEFLTSFKTTGLSWTRIVSRSFLVSLVSMPELETVAWTTLMWKEWKNIETPYFKKMNQPKLWIQAVSYKINFNIFYKIDFTS